MNVRAWRVIAALLTTMCAQASQASDCGVQDVSSTGLASGLVIGGEPAVIYYSNPEGTVGAILPDSGNAIWTSGLIGKPLLVRDNRLLIQKPIVNPPGRLPLAVLDTRDGLELFRIEAPLPDDVLAAFVETPGYRFEAKARGQGDTTIVTWHASVFPETGVAPAPGNAGARFRSGEIEIDLDARTTRLREAGEPDVGTGCSQAILDAAVTEGLTALPHQVDGTWTAPVRSNSGLLLKRWNADASPLPDVKLIEGDFVNYYTASDHRHLLVSRRQSPGENSWEVYIWAIYSMLDGRQLGLMSSPVAFSPFMVIGSILVYTSQPFGRREGNEWIAEPMSLHGFHLVEGSKRWVHPILDPVYRGPRVPGSG